MLVKRLERKLGLMFAWDASKVQGIQLAGAIKRFQLDF
jgi:hypothetical protein